MVRSMNLNRPGPTSRPRSWWEIAALFVVAYLLSWLVWGSVVGEQNDIISFHLPQGIALWTLLIAVLLVAVATGGLAAVRDLMARLLRWRVHWAWYVVAVGLPVGLSLLALGIASLLGDDVPTGVDEPLGGALGYFAFGIVLFGLTEELAWRGFVLPRLQARLTPLTSALILGALWAVWHTPLFFIDDSSQQGWPYLGFVALVLAESVLISWLFNHARGSVLLVALFHAASDASLAWSGTLYGSELAFWVVVGVYLVAAVALLMLRSSEWTGPSSRFPEATYPPG
jgi:membrane protease YdiL (CAAX protease family)